MSETYVKQSECIGEPKFYIIYKKVFKKAHQADKAMAWVLMRDYGNNEADLMMVYSHEKGGYAFELMEYMKTIFHTIRTEWEASTKEGREFCGKCGFEREADLLVYRGNKAEFDKLIPKIDMEEQDAVEKGE